MSRAVGLLVGLSLLVPVPGRAAFHVAVIDEVMSGAAGNPNIQYVEIRMQLAGQNSVAHTRLTVFKCLAAGGGHQVLIDDLGGSGATQPPIPNGAAGDRWIMASPDGGTFNGAAHKSPDFVWNNAATGGIPTACGMVCWGAPAVGLDPLPPNPPTWDAGNPANYIDCVAYGPYDGSAEPLGSAPASATPGDGTFSLTRNNENAFSNSFVLACPSPTNNANNTPGSFGQCPPPGSTTTTPASTTSTTSTSFPAGAGQPVAGTKLLLKTNASKPAKNTLMLIVKDAALMAGDPAQTGGSLRVLATGGDAFDASYPLPASQWKRIGKSAAGKGYRFTDPTGPITSVVVKPGKLAKASGKGPGLGQTLAAAPNSVTVLLATGAERDCALFVNVIKFTPGKTLLAKKNPPPAACP